MVDAKQLPVTIAETNIKPLTLGLAKGKKPRTSLIKWIVGFLLVVVVVAMVTTVDHHHQQESHHRVELTAAQHIELMDENIKNDSLTYSKTEKILLIGGYLNEESLEYFYPDNPEKNTLLNVTLIIPRYAHANILFNETTVLTIGGKNRSVWVGNGLKGEKLRSTELFNSVTNETSPFTNLSIPRSCRPGVALLNGTVHVCGGCGEKLSQYSLNPVWRTCEILNPGTNGSNKIASMKKSRQFFTMVSSHGSLYAIGGQETGKIIFSRSVERYNPIENKWRMVAPMIVRRSGLAATVLNDVIYACGGISGFDKYRAIAESSCEKYNVKNNSWHKIASMHKERSDFVLVTFGNKIVAIGGHGDSDGVENYDPLMDKWTTLPNTIKARYVSSAVVL